MNDNEKTYNNPTVHEMELGELTTMNENQRDTIRDLLDNNRTYYEDNAALKTQIHTLESALEYTHSALEHEANNESLLLKLKEELEAYANALQTKDQMLADLNAELNSLKDLLGMAQVAINFAAKALK